MKKLVFMMTFSEPDLMDFNGVFSTFKKAEDTLLRWVEERKDSAYPWRDFERVDISNWVVDETSEHGWACYEFNWNNDVENITVGVVIERCYIDAQCED
jgi:hypothetical protein